MRQGGPRQWPGLPPSLLRVQGLTVRYWNRHAPVFRDVSFSLNRGETSALIGDSGTGKTTIGYTILNLLPRNAQILEGNISLDGRQLLTGAQWQKPFSRRHFISMVPQDPQQSLNPVLRVSTQISEVIRVHQRLKGPPLAEKVNELLDLVALSDRRILDAYPFELSGGQSQRIVIAQALAAQPVLLIADEPTSALDAANEKLILDLLKALKTRLGLAVLFITHDLAPLTGFADRVLQMGNGELSESTFNRACGE